jgi:hypothetical protein
MLGRAGADTMPPRRTFGVAIRSTERIGQGEVYADERPACGVHPASYTETAPTRSGRGPPLAPLGGNPAPPFGRPTGAWTRPPVRVTMRLTAK